MTKKLRVVCGQCGSETNHETVAEHVSDSTDDDYWWHIEYQIVQCLGCDAVSFREEVFTEFDYDSRTGDPVPIIKLYPPRIEGRRPLEDQYNLPTVIRRVYHEIVDAMNNSSVILAAIGLRALIEGICIDQGIKTGNLEKKIGALASKGVLSVKQAEILHAHRFLGNVAAHEITAAEPKELIAALDIAETLLKTIYILPKLEGEITTGKKKKP